jgi:hypothetical protein
VRRFLAWAAAVVLACDLAVVAVRVLTADATSGRPAPAGSGAGGPSGRGPAGPLPAPDQARVSGRAASVAVDAESMGTIPSPLTIDAPRGVGGAKITDALVGGKRVTIVWDAGRPLDLTGGPGLDPGPVHLELDRGVLTVALDGAPRSLLPGSYRTTAPVAYGVAGLAAPSDGLAFVADARTAITTSGGAVVRLPARPLDLEGPGRVSARGEFTVQTSAGTRRATTIVFGPGPFVARLRPAAGGTDFDATLQGSLDAL